MPDTSVASADAPAQEGAVATEKRRRAPRKKPVAAPTADVASPGAPEPVVPAPTDPAEPPPLEPVVPSTAADGAETAPPREGGRRSRNRRRGRRGGGAADAGAEAEAVVDAAAEERRHLPQPEVGEVFASVLSGDYDTEPAPEDAAEPASVPPKRVLAPDPDAPKLHKVLAQAGIGSRRDMEQLVQEGRITVNGEPAHVGQRISFGDQLRIDGKPIKARMRRRRLACWPITSRRAGRGTTTRSTGPPCSAACRAWRRASGNRWGGWTSTGPAAVHQLGRAGEPADASALRRRARVRSARARRTRAAERERLLEGVPIDGQPCAFKSLEDGGGEGANRWYRVVITEGRNRSAQAVRGRRPCRQPADPRALRLGGAAARPAARRMGRPGRGRHLDAAASGARRGPRATAPMPARRRAGRRVSGAARAAGAGTQRPASRRGRRRAAAGRRPAPRAAGARGGRPDPQPAAAEFRQAGLPAGAAAARDQRGWPDPQPVAADLRQAGAAAGALAPHRIQRGWPHPQPAAADLRQALRAEAPGPEPGPWRQSARVATPRPASPTRCRRRWATSVPTPSRARPRLGAASRSGRGKPGRGGAAASAAAAGGVPG